MMRNIINELMANISPEFTENNARILHASERNISDGFRGLIPTIVYQLCYKLQGDNSSDLFQLLKKEKHISYLNHLDGLLEKENFIQGNPKVDANDFADRLFGTQRKEVLDFFSEKNKLRLDASKGLMTIGTTLVIGYMSKMIRKEGMTLASFKSFLFGQQENIEAALPQGISKWLGDIKPLKETVSAAASATAGTMAATYVSEGVASSDEVGAASGFSWGAKLLMVLLPLLLFWGIWAFKNSDSKDAGKMTKKEVTPIAPSAEEVVQLEPSEPIATEKISEVEADVNSEKESSSIKNNNNEVAKADAIISNNASTKNNYSTQEEKTLEIVTISDPVQVEEETINASSSPGGNVVSNEDEMSSKGEMKTTIKEVLSTKGSIKKAETSASATISYEDYIKKVTIPESVSGGAMMVEREETPVHAPEWYMESKKVVNGMSANVTIEKKTETMMSSRNTSSSSLPSSSSLSLTQVDHQAWFKELINPTSSIEYRFFNYIDGKNDSGFYMDKYTWLNMDDVRFGGFSSQLNMGESSAQLNRIASILKDHPNTKIKLGGFTSDVGKRRANRKLSKEMAEQVKGVLVKMGVDENQLRTKGYGESHPRSLNDTEAGRKRNHRVGFRVMSK